MIKNRGYHAQTNSIPLLTNDMLTAVKMLHPNNEVARFNVTNEQPLYYKPGGKNNRNDRKHRRSDRCKSINHGQQNQKRLNHQQAEFKDTVDVVQLMSMIWKMHY